METKENILKENDALLLKEKLCELEKENARLKLVLRNVYDFIKNGHMHRTR